ncbi:Powdery mildew resistance protein RPW8 domain [Arabidopsis thaliana x Arabidopsis arenosa]|uniref:Powdery mildew resistance protein RPW8 domain n=2 Tax=Arabidopsis TaxID=3701 RepID=A0A8T1ZY67_ARASU|nr:Powdery mildew resistance protein RPW8 domain [Arabidopsis thaliana x Arabidopsis arenosa]KAG7565165.1 Powdery mildew resistance protein RPW8 domain [Arabidopsis suecica]
MIAEVAAGGALGIGLSVLQETVKRAKDRSVTTRFILKRLKATIDNITPLMVQIDMVSEQMEDPSLRKVSEHLKLLLESAVSLVEANAELRRRNLCKKFRYMREIKEFEAELRGLVDVDVQVNQWADIKALKANMSEIITKLDKIMHQPTECICCKNNCSTSQSTNQDIVEETDRSPEKNAECSNDGWKLKIDINIGWWSRKQNKCHGIRFALQ